MKRVLMAAVMLGASMPVFATAPGGPGCGWGNMLFEGQSGLPIHLVATIVNGTSGNKTFGMTSGTNGCSTSGALAYDGESMLAMNGMVEEVAQDMATGEGDALTALSVSMGIAEQDRARFQQVMHENFATVFPSDDVTAADVMNNIVTVMKQDRELATYVG